MKKSTYLIVLFLISFSYFSFLYKNPLFYDITLVLSWLWGGLGLVYYGSSQRNILNIYDNKKYTYWFIGIMLISTLSPFAEFNQPILDTIIAQRANYSIIFLIIFLKICPTKDDFFIALRFCSFLTIILSVFSIFNSDIFLDEKSLESFEYNQDEGSTDIITFGGGVGLFFMYFLMLLDKFYNNFNKKLLLELLIFIIILILFQNRSRLFISIPIILYVIFSISIKYKPVFLFIILSFFSVGLYFSLALFETMYFETIDQINNPNYNRWQAINFYILEYKSNLLTFLFGHGTPASGGQYLDIVQNAAKSRLAYLSDIGLLGSYFQYGILFLILIYSFCLKSLKSYQPLYLKFYSLYIILVPTIHGFGNNYSSSAILFSSFFYLVLFHRQKHRLTIIK